MIDRATLPQFHTALASWFAANGRRGLPWRDAPTPYAVLVSEFMLQQTTVATVIPRFKGWMTRFPDIATLASATEAEVLKHWEGLGYYSRARNLHRAANAIATLHSGIIPSDPAALRSLPGIGPYTASAIAAFAFDKCVPVLDANIIRLAARLANFESPVSTAQGMASIERIATALLPPTGGRAHTSALMDLGSIICHAGVPDCLSCPVKSFCKAQSPALLPVKPPRKKTTEVVEARSIAASADGVHLLQSAGPRWKGLWTLPPCTDPEEPVVTITHAITRYKVRLELHASAAEPHWTLFPLDNLPAMPSPHRKALALALQKIGIGSASDF
jgi:A/G-specific adenine glycosylase